MKMKSNGLFPMHGSDLKAGFLTPGSFDRMKLMGRSRSHWPNQKMRLLGVLGPCHDESLMISLCQKSRVHCVQLVNWWVAENMPGEPGLCHGPEQHYQGMEESLKMI